MTIKPIDMQVLVPRAGEVEKINRTVQGQQQTDQQIVGQAIREDLKLKEQIVIQMQATEHKKIEKEKEQSDPEGKRQQKEKNVVIGSQNDNQQKEEEQKQNKIKTGRYLDLKI